MGDILFNIMIFVVIALGVVAVLALIFFKCFKTVNNVNEFIYLKKMNGTSVYCPQMAIVFPYINSFKRVSKTPRRILVAFGNNSLMSKIVEENHDGSDHNAVLKASTDKGMITKDDVRVDMLVEFKIKLNTDDQQEALNAVGHLGDNLDTAKKLADHLRNSLEDVIKSVTMKLNFKELYNDRENFTMLVKESLKSIEGLIITEVSVPYVEHTPVDKLDPNNYYDARSISYIYSETAKKEIEKKGIEEMRLTQITETEVKGQQERLQLNKSLEQEKAKNEREILNTQEEERTKIAEKIKEEELKRKQIEIETAKQIEIAEENKRRDVETATLNNQEIVDVREQEKIKSVRTAEIDAEMATQKRKLENETELAENEKSLVAKQSEVVAIRDTLVKKEEEIKDTQAFKDVDRNARVLKTQAQAESDADKIRQIVSAEALKEKAVIEASQKQIDADADFSVTKRRTEAEDLEIEIEIKRQSAPLKAEADARVVQAEAIKLQGEAEANVVKMKGEAEAEAISKKGIAEAESLREKYKATDEAGDNTRRHEINLTELNNERILKEAQIKANEAIGVKKAEALGQALGQAQMKIIGDPNMFKSVMDALNSSEKANTVLEHNNQYAWLKPYYSGEKDITQEVKEILSSIGSNGEGVTGSNDLVKLALFNEIKDTPMFKNFFNLNNKA